MIECNIYKNTNADSKYYGKWYPRNEPKGIIELEGLAQHMSEHNTPFSKGVIYGVLTDMVNCIRELALEGKSIKIENLALFKCNISGSPANDPGCINLATNIKAVRLVAQATGQFTKAELAKDARFRWTSKAQAEIEKWKKEHEQPEP